MCGIVAILSRPASRPAPTSDELLTLLDEAVVAIDRPDRVDALGRASEPLEVADALLRGVPGVEALVAERGLEAEMVARLDRLDAAVDAVERELEAGEADSTPEQIELCNAALVRARDALWALRHDRLRTAHAVVGLARRDAGPASLAAFSAVQMAL
ncbi:MAG TPA: glucosamine-6-phosphate synthase, partial [Acidimicrobiales bacterium]